MKRLFFLTILVLAGFYSKSQDDFKILKQLPVTEVKNQAQSGTCWSFATISFLESELLRTGRGEYDLSEMYMVHYAYLQKAMYYMLRQGKANFSSGGQSHDVMDVIRNYGVVPEQVYTGLKEGDKRHNHSKMDRELRILIKAAAKKKIPVNEAVEEIEKMLDSFLGAVPGQFTYNGQEYTPQSFKKSLGIQVEDYLEITSFLHLPLYEKSNLQIPDNWSGDSYYNVSLDELIAIMKHALDYGYTICWDGDVSGNFNRVKGTAEVDQEEDTVSPQAREEKFLDFTTTDDHLMHITGMATDENGRLYFITKNSWGDAGKYDGYWYMSENYVRMNTVAIMIHKDALPEEIAAKLSLK